jgi:hypothetical protein
MLLNQTDLLQQMKADLREMIDTVEAWKKLDKEKLNAKPSAKSWSALECLQHMNKSHEVYHKQFVEQIKASRQEPLPEFFVPTWTGKIAYNSMRPQSGVIKAKMPTMSKMKPDTELGKASELDKEQVLDQFLNMQREFLELLDHAETINLQKHKIQTELPLIKMRLGDAMRFILAHGQRHTLQAQRAVNQAA